MAQLHYGDQQARRQAADVDHDDAMKLQGEGYCVQEHHGRNDPFTADKESPADISACYGKQGDARKAFPTSDYENLEATQDDASGHGGQPNQGDKRKASPTSDYNHVTMPKDEGYTSLGFKESQDDNNSEISLGVLSEEGTSMKNREGSPPYESMAKELEDHSATEGGIVDLHSLKKDFVDLYERNTDELARERECSPNGILGITEEEEKREGAPQGSYKDEQEETESAPHESAMAKKVEGGSAVGGGIIDVQSLKEDYVNFSEGNTNEPKVDDASHADISQFTSQIQSAIDDPKRRYSVDDPKQEFPIDDSSKQEDYIDATKQDSPIDATKQDSPIDDAKQDLARACPNDDDTHGCESFQGDDGKERIEAEGYNIYSGELENVVYNAAEALGDQQEKLPTHENEADAAIKAHEDLSAQEESSVPKQVSGFDIMESEQISVSDIKQAGDFDSKEHHDEHKEPFTEHVSSEVDQDAVFKLDSKNRDIEDASERESAKNVPADEESPYTEFNCIDDYVKAGYGAEGFVPKPNEDVDKELREPTEKVYQEEERRPTDENPLAKQEGNEEMASSEDAYGTKEGNVKGIAHGKDDDDNINNREIDNIDVPKRPPSLPHPQPEDLAEEAFNNKNNMNEDDGHQNHEEPHKKGVFEKIKEKLTPHFTSN